MDRLHVRHLPVLEDGKLVGILSARDLMARRTEHLNRMVEMKTQELLQANKQLQDRDTELRLHMTVAGRLQTRLLPANPPSLPEIDIHAHYAPLDPLGGDYYDFVQTDTRHLGILIADASGHSIPAAMVAIMTRTAFAAAARDVLRPAPVLAAINAHLHGLTGEHFVTAFYGLFHRDTRTLTYANAGHPLPYRFARASGACTPLVARGTMLGILPEANYDEHEIQLQPGDKLCFYTDGLVDAHNDAGEHYGGIRLQECLGKHGTEPAGAVVALVVNCLTAFRGVQPVKDDLTILIADVRLRLAALHCSPFPGETTMDILPMTEITLRDWFAGQALISLLDDGQSATTASRRQANYENFAIQAYALADAMLKVRKLAPGGPK
jgi:serine phosphatase RsbU (regulator of sigma subunit)